MQRKFKARQDSAVGRVFMKTTHGFRAAVNVVGVVAGMAALSGCMGSPTYGTDKSASEQLMQDLGQSVSITGDQDTRKLKRSEEHTSELQSLMRISYAVFCLNKKTKNNINERK